MRVAIVTGATRGIGRANRHSPGPRLRRCYDRGEDSHDVAETVDFVRAVGAGTMIVARELREPDSSDDVVRTTVGHFGRVSALTCIAGAASQLDLFALTDEQWDEGSGPQVPFGASADVAALQALKASQGSVAIASGTSAYTPKASPAAVGAISVAILALPRSSPIAADGQGAGQHDRDRSGHGGSATVDAEKLCR